MEWIDDNHIKGELSEKEFAIFLDKETASRDYSRYGRDGNVEVYKEDFVYLNVPFEIRIIRYYQLGVSIDLIRSRVKCNKWALAHSSFEMISALETGNDTLCNYSDHVDHTDWTLRHQVEWLIQACHGEIENLVLISKKKLEDMSRKAEMIREGLETIKSSPEWPSVQSKLVANRLEGDKK